MQKVCFFIAKFFLAYIAISSMAFATMESNLAQSNFLYDENRLLTSQEIDFLKTIVTEVKEKSDVKIATILMDESHTSETYAFAKNVANKWRLDGDSTKGILIFVSMKERSKHIIASNGFKAKYPDINFNQIQQETLIPSFRIGKYGRGILSFVWQISTEITAVDGNTISADPKQIFNEESFPWYNYIFIIIVFGCVIATFIYAHPKKFNHHANKKQECFNGKFGTFSNFNGRFKS